ncbi:ABC transporter ATP-binding protein [Dysgonomonas sp. ZJ709]|uniref:ABC transporter ATP-binding protein n=1 Tax=Dysgonomonas sp. ZJ709 TaxID=2709797 RepID=UPI0013EA21D8|nr:ABC transporter ATP-binding protein [Dysgonomonas sp. ZJ709]
MEQKKIISARNISIGYGKTKRAEITCLHSDLSFDLFKGELTCLLGANGSGKSTLLRTLSASQHALKGNIYFDNKDITTYKEKDLSQLLGLVLTDKTAVGGLTVRELVELGRYPYTGFFGQLSKYDKDISEKAMIDVNIIYKADSYVAELSDGERQKAMIAKSLAQECPVLLLDEPTAFLDIESRIEIMNLLHDLTMNQGKTILLSTHDIDIALLLADRLWLLSKDNGLSTGVTEDVVLSGKMDNFFKSENIVFDKESGNFYPKLKSGKNVSIQGDSSTYRWGKNILERHGFHVIEKKNEALFSLNLSQLDSIVIEINGKDVRLSGFDELAQWLRSYEEDK